MSERILTCNRCYESWAAEVKNPKRCPRCKSPYWNKPRKYKLKSKPEATPTAYREPRAA